MRNTNKLFPYSGPHRYEYDDIDAFFFSVRAHDGTTSVELIFGTKTLLNDVYAIWSNSGLNIANVLQDLFFGSVIPINIWSDNSQE